jgi:LCP family protein required for cell wall assembly
VTRLRGIYRDLSIFLIIAVLLGIILLFLWNMPLGPRLQLPTRTAVETAAHSPLTLPEEPTQEPANNSWQGSSEETVAQSKAQINPDPEPFCGGPALMTILLIGSDYRGDGFLYGLADAIRIVRVDFTTPAVSVLDFPRDLWVEIPGIADHYGLTHGKLNQAYFYGTPGMGYYDGPGEGAGLLARTLDLNFNVQVDHYLTLQMKTLAEAVDAVGGVEITFDTGVDLNAVVGPTYPQLLFSAGTYHFNGELAVHLVTNRKPSTFQRTRYQNMLIFALRDKLLAPEMLPKMPGLALSFIGDTQTDLSLNEINQLVCVARMVTDENIRIVSFPEQLFTPSHIFDPNRHAYTYIDDADFELLRAYFAQFMNGSWSFP